MFSSDFSFMQCLFSKIINNQTNPPAGHNPPPKWQLGQNPLHPNRVFIVLYRIKIMLNYVLPCLDGTAAKNSKRKANIQFMYPTLTLFTITKLPSWLHTVCLCGFRNHGSKCEDTVLSTEGYIYSHTNKISL